jgi:hypothetical protein
MTTLAQAVRALSDARLLNTRDAWRDAALAFADAAARHPGDFKEKLKRIVKTAAAAEGPRHAGKVPLLHVGRCTFADGYSVRVTIGQFKGESIDDSLKRLARFAIACWRNDHQKMPHARGRARQLRQWVIDLAREIDDAKHNAKAGAGVINAPMVEKTIQGMIDRLDRLKTEAAMWDHVAKHGGCAPVNVGIGEVDYAIKVPDVTLCQIVKPATGDDIEAKRKPNATKGVPTNGADEPKRSGNAKHKSRLQRPYLRNRPRQADGDRRRKSR